MMRVPVNGVHLNVEQTGDGLPLLLLHGFTGSCETWSPFESSLGRHFRLISIDLPGHGQSDSPGEPQRYRMERAAQDVLAILDRLGLNHITVLGYSMGGRLALHVVLAAPDRIRALVLESTSPGIPDSDDRAIRIESDEELAQVLEHEGIETFVDRWERQTLFSSQTRLTAAARARLREQRLRNNPAGLAGSLRGAGAGAQKSLWGQLPVVCQPTLIIVGAEDTKYRRIGCEMAEALPVASLVVVPRAGHTVHLEQPSAFEQQVLNFLSRRETIGHSLAESNRLPRYSL
jgi:2-succinyl-6-hydroxy-2,4-cyclohexadiene-1-carboxylate synthase